MSPLTITVIFAVYAIGALGAALTVGPISDAVGRKPVLIAALLSILLGLALFLVADTAVVLIIARFLHGAAIGAITVTAGAALLDVRPQAGARNGTASGIALNVGITVTVISAAAAAEWAAHPLRVPYAVVGIVVLLMLGAVIVMTEPHTDRPGGRIRIQPPSVPKEIRSDFWFSGIGIITTWSVLGVFMSLYPSLTQRATGHTSVMFVGLVVAIMAAAAATAQWLGRNLDPRIAAISGDVGMIAALLCAVLALRSGSTTFILIDSIALGATFGLAFGGSLRHLNNVAPPDARGRVMSAYYLLGYLAMGIPTVVAGALASRFGTAQIFPWFAGVVAAGCLGAAILGLLGTRRPALIEDQLPL